MPVLLLESPGERIPNSNIKPGRNFQEKRGGGSRYYPQETIVPATERQREHLHRR